MWDVSQLGHSPIRPLRPEEAELIRLLRYKGSGKELQEELAESLVTDMEDGGMGSIRFVRPNSKQWERK